VRKNLTAKPIAAFFDIDGTLVPEPSLERRLFASLRRTGAIPVRNYGAWISEAVRLLPKGMAALRCANKRYLQGIDREKVFTLLETISFYREALERVAWHARLGHTIVLVSGTLERLAEIAAIALECELEARGCETCLVIRATRLGELRGSWTGHTLGPVMVGEEKSRAVQQFIQKMGLHAAGCFAYGNSLRDREMLSEVGRPQVVNPGREMAALANRRDWPIWHWHREQTMISPDLSRIQTIIPGRKLHR
jgi:phosphoserine phosphatase